MRFSRQQPSVDGAVVIVTGGARGIGAKTAEVFSARGATVWIGDVDADVAATTAAGIPAAEPPTSMSPSDRRGIASSPTPSEILAASTSW